MRFKLHALDKNRDRVFDRSGYSSAGTGAPPGRQWPALLRQVQALRTKK
jgi:hypothetical protein